MVKKKAKQRAPKYPRRLYVKPMRDGAEDYYLSTLSPAELADKIGDTVIVGVYQFVRIARVSTKVEVK